MQNNQNDKNIQNNDFDVEEDFDGQFEEFNDEDEGKENEEVEEEIITEEYDYTFEIKDSDTEPIVDFDTNEINWNHPFLQSDRIVKCLVSDEEKEFLQNAFNEMAKNENLTEEEQEHKDRLNDLLEQYKNYNRELDGFQFSATTKFKFLNNKTKQEVLKEYIQTALQRPEEFDEYQKKKADSVTNNSKKPSFNDFIDGKTPEEVAKFITEIYEYVTDEKVNVDFNGLLKDINQSTLKTEYDKGIDIALNAFFSEFKMPSSFNKTSLTKEEQEKVNDLRETYNKENHKAFSSMVKSVIKGTTQISSRGEFKFNTDDIGKVAMDVFNGLKDSDKLSFVKIDSDQVRDALDAMVDGVKESPKALNKFYESLGIKHEKVTPKHQFTPEEMKQITADKNSIKPAVATYQRLNEIHAKRPWYFPIIHPNQNSAEKKALAEMKSILKDTFKVDEKHLSAYKLDEHNKKVLIRPYTGDKLSYALSMNSNPNMTLAGQRELDQIVKNTENRMASLNEVRESNEIDKKELSNEDKNKIIEDTNALKNVTLEQKKDLNNNKQEKYIDGPGNDF